MPGISQKTYVLDTHRLRDPEETLAIVKPFLKQMGISRIANLTGLDRVGLPTVMVTRPNSRSVAVSLGKGLSLSAAQASGVMEAIESWHAERIELPLRLSSFADLAQDRVVDIDRLPRVTGGQFDPHRAMLWVQGRVLPSDQTCWVPYEMVDTDYTTSPVGGQRAFPRTTNGLASGNDVIEASCHAICELIERDATTLWHHQGATPRVDPATVDDPRCRQAMDRFSAAGLELGIWDTTSDIGIASFRCAIGEIGGAAGHIGIGDGCHPDRAIALLRALTEAAQTRLTYISGARDDLDPEEFSDSARSWRSRYVHDLIDGSPATDDFSSCPTYVTESFSEDLSLLLTHLASVGMDQVVTVDLSRPEIDIAVVRAVIPGLEAPHDDLDFIAGPRAQAVTS
ncbi:ribosomal protein S12 methylthiotransferase accessory factor [Ruegeria halocynthiae]|uniref:Ribosomal protein S12 methylthiotransferase accessory factor n=1 Tax=Ruegeria halocynthiae TaxID=985054 RepID=A0A1H3A2Q5_9RHOB|nr:YcaO-like family protein [Ruegeria halocynthiae]SDX24052.1 ribosomal protein S12 methylthiotransferase accessory factor [Ruegeria halocynthiae]